MSFSIDSELLLQKYACGYSATVSDDQSLVCLWNVHNNIEIYRTNGGYLINRLNDEIQNHRLIDVVWHGNDLFCCYNSGTVSIYREGRELVKQLTFIPKGAKTKCILCDNLVPSDDRYSLSDGNLLNSMPKLNKWDMIKNELDNELILNSELGKKKPIDIFMAIDSKTNKLILSIEGTLNIKVGEKLKLPKDIKRIIKVSSGKYMCLGKDWSYQVLDLTFLQDPNIYKLIKTTQEYSALLRYLKQLHRHLRMKLTEPYFEFVETLLKEEHKNALQELFYMGVTKLEVMEELHEVQLQTFRLDKWSALSNDLCSNSIGLMVACTIPLLERMIVLAASIEALCEAITWIKFPNEIWVGSKLRERTVETLKSVRSQTDSIMKNKKTQELGLMWIRSLSDSLSKMERNRDQISPPEPETTNGSNNFSFFGSSTGITGEDSKTLQKRADINTVEKFLAKDLLPEKQYEWVKTSFPNLILETQAEFDKIIKDYTLKWLKRQMSVEFDQTRNIQTGDNVDQICDIRILRHEDSSKRVLLVTPTELILLNLQTQKIDVRSPLPLPSHKVAMTLTRHNTDPAALPLKKQQYKNPRLQLVPISAGQPSLSTAPVQNITEEVFFLLPLCQTVTVFIETAVASNTDSILSPDGRSHSLAVDHLPHSADLTGESHDLHRHTIRIV